MSSLSFITRLRAWKTVYKLFHAATGNTDYRGITSWMEERTA